MGVRAALPAATVVGYVERDAFAAAVLVAGMEDATLDRAPIFDEIEAFDAKAFRGVVDLVVGGTPCTNLSVAGNREGLDGDESKLFFEFVRIVKDSAAPWFFWENVGGAKSELPRVFAEFERIGYEGKATSVRAGDVGAPQIRKRFFVLGRRVGHSGRLAGELRRARRVVPGPVAATRSGGLSPAGCEPRAAGAGVGHPDDAGRERRDGGDRRHPDERVVGTPGGAVEHATGEGREGGTGGWFQRGLPLPGRGDVDDPESGRLGGRGGSQPKGARSGRCEVDGAGGNLADASGDHGHEATAVHDGRGARVGGGSQDLADSGGNRGIERPGEPLAGRPEPDPGGSSDVADTDSEGRSRKRVSEQPGLGGAPGDVADGRGGAGATVADADSGARGEQESGRGEERRDALTWSGRDPGVDYWLERTGRPFEWPPGRSGDEERWRFIGALRPDLLPAQLPPPLALLRRVVDGVDTRPHSREACAPWFDWADRLRVLGNGVVPKQAAAALTFLVLKMEGETP